MNRIAQKLPVYGHGINDNFYPTQVEIDGKKKVCPLYRKWTGMLERVFSDKYHSIHPTYIGCTIAKEWLIFSVFREWLEGQDWKGKELDKDILTEGNKHYSPEMCVLVDHATNKLLTDRVRDRGKYPVGVNYHKGIKGKKNFVARCNHGDIRAPLGVYFNPEDAHAAYKIGKAVLFARAAIKQTDNRVREALLKRAYHLNGNNDEQAYS
jgi:hypothetical protein